MSTSNEMKTMRNKDKTMAISKSIENGKRHPLSYIDSRRYVQHNLSLGDGLGPLLEYFDQLPPGTSSVNPLRAIEDGDISLAHIEYHIEPYGHVVGFEVHRWEDGRVVEHWDNLQPVPAEPNISGHTAIDGTTEVSDHHLTEQNKDLAARYVQQVLVGRSLGDLEEFIHHNSYTEHRPTCADGIDHLRGTLQSPGANASVVHTRLHRVTGEGNFVLTMSEGESHASPVAIFDLFRVAEQRIVEHWDVVEPIPPRHQWKNNNGKF
jgi:predicted SnoaL-like aldol condensation-catalyzing enzyme